MNFLRKLANGRRGGVLPLVAAATPFFIALVGLVLDGGLFALRQTQLNSAADSAALAAASAVDLALFDKTERVELLQGEAKHRAVLFANRNYRGATVTVTFIGNRRVRVRLQAASETVFLRAFGVKTTTITAEAEAQAG